MNKPAITKRTKFAEYVTSIAFNIQLSHAMVETLCSMAYWQERDKLYDIPLGLWHVHTRESLERRGLVEYIEPPRAPKQPMYQLSEEGLLVLKLLRLAGLDRMQHCPEAVELPPPLVTPK